MEFIEQTTFSIASRLKLLRPDMNLDNDDLFLLDSMAEPLVKSWLQTIVSYDRLQWLTVTLG